MDELHEMQLTRGQGEEEGTQGRNEWQIERRGHKSREIANCLPLITIREPTQEKARDFSHVLRVM